MKKGAVMRAPWGEVGFNRIDGPSFALAMRVEVSRDTFTKLGGRGSTPRTQPITYPSFLDARKHLNLATSRHRAELDESCHMSFLAV